VIHSNPRCKDCGSQSETVHHPIYDKGAAPWEYEDSGLIALCWPCHKARHWQDDLIQREILTLSGSVPYPIWVSVMNHAIKELQSLSTNSPLPPATKGD
jgi:hypothetical protein